MAEMRKRIPFGKTGRTRETVNSRKTPKGFTVFSNDPIARFLDQGTKPHIIKPKTAKALRWFGVFGNPIFARSVNHPGTSPLFFVQKTRAATKDKLRELAANIWRHILGVS